jgi:hypothetical protein
MLWAELHALNLAFEEQLFRGVPEGSQIVRRPALNYKLLSLGSSTLLR